MRLIQSLTTLKKKVAACSGDVEDLDEAAKLFDKLEVIVARVEMMNYSEKILGRKL